MKEGWYWIKGEDGWYVAMLSRGGIWMEARWEEADCAPAGEPIYIEEPDYSPRDLK